ncbi:nucleoside hydrolase-like domain-containing protein [Geofilum rhodophaeum]|uniref:nucleoside hydrolase-like domain-containing protein n=1 Tax=Geofilum rhodophaeum TaxID=1965019 RepID=UPI000B5202A5|nr:nucleoside hydrolase-like domain-containing protein [Geofilum rhodophaeum]
MKTNFLWLLLPGLFLSSFCSSLLASNYKPRIINTTDLGADPDDEQSLVRQLVCANEFDIEGLIVSTSCWKKTQSGTKMLNLIVDAYAQVYSNLKIHAKGYPSPEYLRSITVMGQSNYGMNDVGPGKDSPGSELIIAAADKEDPRPLWVMGWGGMNTVAQAIWKVNNTRTPEETALFLSKLRLYDVLGQDDAGAWIAKNFPEVFYIRATGVYGWQPEKNSSYYREHIQTHGPLGAIYPDTQWAPEGDTPSFLHVYPNGLNDPEKVNQGGWGGRFSMEKMKGIRSMSEVAKIDPEAEPKYDPYFMYGNSTEGAMGIKKWEDGYNNDFLARMDWSISNHYEAANHHPVAVLNGDKSRQVLYTTAKPGSIISLSSEHSFDPDGDSLSYFWHFYKEAGTYTDSLELQKSGPSLFFEIPETASGKTIHIVLEIHDHGTPKLYAYRRMIVSVK